MWIDIGLYFMYTLLILAAIAAFIVFPVMRAIDAPMVFLKSLYGIGALVVLFVISYAISSSKVLPQWGVLGISEGTSKLVGAGLIMFYITAIIAVIALIFSEINKALK